jgi:hypothetical protein
MPSIEQQISQIRDLINEPRKQHLLLRNHQLWNQLCSSLDVVQDTDVAMEAYLQNVFPEDTGEKYIRVYGILQVLVVQQDAVKHLITSLKLPSSMYVSLEAIKHIREIRIRSIGHPTEKRTKEGQSYHFISRATMHKEGFQLMSCLPHKENEFEDINISMLINKQRHTINGMLNEVINELKKQEQEHKEKFKGDSLTDIFTKNNVRYIVSKVWESIHSDAYPASLGLMHLELIQKSLVSLKQALQKRDLWGAYDSVNYIYKEIEYPIGEVEKYFRGKNDLESSRDRARVNFFFIDKHLENLEQIAKEIDEDYNTEAQKKRRHPRIGKSKKS